MKQVNENKPLMHKKYNLSYLQSAHNKGSHELYVRWALDHLVMYSEAWDIFAEGDHSGNVHTSEMLRGMIEVKRKWLEDVAFRDALLILERGLSMDYIEEFDARETQKGINAHD